MNLTIKITKRYLIAIFFCSRAFANNSNEIEEIKELLAQQNKILLQQKQTIEKIQAQNSKLRQVIENFPDYLVTDELDSQVPDQDFAYQTPADPQWRFSFTPRTALRFNTFHDIASSDSSFLSVEEETAYWTNGATFSVTTSWLPDTTFLFTGLYGFDKGKRNTVINQPVSSGITLGFPFEAQLDSELFEFEIIARTLISRTNANWLIGLQYTKLNTDAIYISGLDTPVINTLLAKNTNEIWILKAGLGGFFNLSDDGKHRIFSNGLIGASYNNLSSNSNGGLNDNADWWGGAIDINLGYEWIVNENFSISPRYRSQFGYFNTDDTPVDGQFFILHGPELHFVLRF